MVRTILAAIGIIAIALAVAVGIQARHGGRPAALAVSTDDLALDTAQGVATLEGRIADSVIAICGGDKECRRSAYGNTRRRVAAVLADKRFSGKGDFVDPVSIEPQLLDLPGDQRRWIEGPILRAFQRGRPDGWWSWPYHGRIRISEAVVFGDVECRNVRATITQDGEEVVMAQGLRCAVPDLFPVPRPRRSA